MKNLILVLAAFSVLLTSSCSSQNKAEEVVLEHNDQTSIYSQKELKFLMKKIEVLPMEERSEIESIVVAKHLTLSCLKRLEMGSSNLRAWSLDTFVCNMFSGGIKTLWGTEGAGIAMALDTTSAVVIRGMSVIVGNRKCGNKYCNLLN
ncbi:hypothetical protein QYZ87_00960 [Porphyromonadaceae bacterium W3.11]|nr:hypothetical protein [Porphyromonadaceae bacterium W3.11]